MDPSFIPVEVVPSKTPFGLDQLRRSYKTALSAEAAIAAAPAVGAVDEVFPCMFLMPISAPERAESATRIDLLYMGTIQFTGTGVEGDPFLPVLPDQKHDATDAVQSASSSRSVSGNILSSPMTAQYYAPSNQLSYFSFGGAGSIEADDPADDIRIITLTLGDTTLSVTGLVEELIADFFSVQIVESAESHEIVPGAYWQNSSRKTKSLTPYIFSLPSGPFLILAVVGSGYAVSDTLTIAGGGGTAVIVLTQVGIAGSITGWTISSITCTFAQNLVAATGGGGFGAKFNIVIAP